MVESKPRVGEQRSGGRAARVRSDVLRCTDELLTEVGYDKLTIDQVAARAGVHKTTVYRRWITKAELVADAVGAFSAEAVQAPDTGSFAEDLELLARQVAANIGSNAGGSRARSLVTAAGNSEELTETLQRFWTERLTAATPIVERAIDRGEIPPTADANLIIEAVIGPLWVRLLLTGEPIDEDFAARVAALIAAGAAL